MAETGSAGPETMRHGLSFLPDGEPGRHSAVDYFAMLRRLSRMGDEAGMSHVKMTEHYLLAYGGFCPSPLGFLASIAGITSRIRLMTGCLLPAFHHPLQLASDTAMLDAMSGGRVDIGVARAYMPYEFEAFGLSMDSSRDRFDHAVAAMERLWREESVTVTSPFFQLTDVTSLPRPVQPGGPPVWVAAVRSPESFVNAGREGRGLLVTPSIGRPEQMAPLVQSYRDSYEPHFVGDHPRVLASLPLYVGRTDQQARAVADPLLAHYLRVWTRSADHWNKTSSADYQGYTGMGNALRAYSPARLRTDGGAIVGGVDHVVERIEQIQQALELDGFLWQIDFGAVDAVTATANLELFLDQVEPRLHCWDTQPAAVEWEAAS